MRPSNPSLALLQPWLNLSSVCLCRFSVPRKIRTLFSLLLLDTKMDEARGVVYDDGILLLERQIGCLELADTLCGRHNLMNNGEEGYIAIWQKNANVKGCITRLPENGYGANITNWPARLHSPPDRLFSIQMDAYKSRKELYKTDSKYHNDIVKGYIAAFLDFQVNNWVMNVVPISGTNTLHVIYDRGLIGVMHDWCEPFDTPPRTYDLLNAVGLFSVEQKRCNITNIMLEMNQILRPGGRAYTRDITSVINDL
ncbi:hypothetical protein ACS0TY_003161 [Phlomoides rotata]